jgi:hypothetical protein
MTTGEQVDAGFVRDWLVRLLAREGAILEPTGDDALFAVLPPVLQEELRLPEAPTLRILEPPRPGETALALEGEVLRACLARAEARGALAAARLVAPARKQSGLHEAARRCLHVDNAAVREVESRTLELRVLLLEVGFLASADERTAGSLLVACEPTFAVAATGWADVLHEALAGAAPDERLPAAAELETALPLARAAAAPVLAARLAPFFRAASVRLAKERQRLTAYHDRLLAEAARRRARTAAGVQALAAKRAAIAARREEKLAELEQRFAPAAAATVRSALALHYQAGGADFVVRRRTRERTVTIVWDPFLHAPLPRACDACHNAATAFQACDAAVHLCCARCARPCAACARGLPGLEGLARNP